MISLYTFYIEPQRQQTLRFTIRNNKFTLDFISLWRHSYRINNNILLGTGFFKLEPFASAKSHISYFCSSIIIYKKYNANKQILKTNREDDSHIQTELNSLCVVVRFTAFIAFSMWRTVDFIYSLRINCQYQVKLKQ